MISHRFLFLLILIMFITPVISVFSHYSSITSQLSSEYIVNVTASFAHSTNSGITHNTEPCQQHNKSKLFCETNSLCSFSVCGYGYITTAFLVLTLAYSTYRYKQIRKHFRRSLFIPPEIKPPIYSL